MDVFEKAVIFAVQAHEGMRRKKDRTPYILHPLEVAAIAGTITDDPEVLAAAVLHDTVEDTATAIEDIAAAFGPRVAALVASETENKRAELPPAESWQLRKEESLRVLKDAADPGTRIVWLADKLSNARAFYRLRERCGNNFLEGFNQRDPARQAWYYRTVAAYTRELSHTGAWREFAALTDKIFEGVEE